MPDNSYSSEDPGAGGFLVGDGEPKGLMKPKPVAKPTKKSVNYRHADLMSRKRCGTCSMFTPTSADGLVGHCDLGWQAQKNYVCDDWDQKQTGTDVTDPVHHRTARQVRRNPETHE